MRPFIIDDTTKQAIERIKSYAETHVYSMDDLLDIKNKEKDSVIADQEGFTCNLPFGYRVVYSLEEQPAGTVRHLSISVPEDNKLPNQLVVEELMKLIGFEKTLVQLKRKNLVFLEQIGKYRQAINVLEVIDK